MSLFSAEGGLFLVLTLVNVLGFAVCASAARRQAVVLPTAVAHVGLFFYGVIPGLYLLAHPHDAFAVLYITSDLEVRKILAMYLAASLGCALASFFWAPKAPSVRPIASAGERRGYLVVIAGSIVTFWLFDRSWSTVGGLSGFLFSGTSRLELGESVWGQSPFLFFNYYVLNGIFSALLFMLTEKERRAVGRVSAAGKVALVVGLAFPLANLLGGTRQILFSFVIAWGVAGTYFGTLPSRGRLLALATTAFLVMNLVGNTRALLRNALAGADRERLSAADVVGGAVFPSEALTGYIPAAIVMASGEETFNEPQYAKVVPRTIARLIGMEKQPHFSELLATHGVYSRGYNVYTVTLPVDAYYGLGRQCWAVLLYSALLFGTYNMITVLLLRHQTPVRLFVYIVMMVLVWTIVRYDINRSSSRLWQTGLFCTPVALLAGLGVDWRGAPRARRGGLLSLTDARQRRWLPPSPHTRRHSR